MSSGLPFSGLPENRTGGSLNLTQMKQKAPDSFSGALL
jgi:hypothetical protein